MRRLLILLFAAGMALVGCSATAPNETPPRTARAELLSIVSASTTEFDRLGGSETTFSDGHQYALIYDPAASAGHQVVTADLADATSVAFGTTSSIALNSLPNVLASKEFADTPVTASGSTFTVASASVSLTVASEHGIVTKMMLTAGPQGSSATQDVLMTYGINSAARRIFEPVAQKPGG